ncbi:uncharacterized protein [Physcomitrium patens]|uniref:uncharacterized protein isoform X1 n=1 Tax=Physcomitrium patens TaxID=3218 RepID=UPI000D15396F|nr:uncharacterized protein LOC112289647 isoform X1 [Physcomitrium patens]|eukprot:XP_024390792.1 uncharacterized protein LOC112289647 isoform X1 [Physcomitrella patens]
MEQETEVMAMAETEEEKKAAAAKRAKKLMLPKDLPSKYDHAHWRPKHGKDAGTAELHPYHRAKLRALLDSLLQEHLYSAASGPVSVLFQAHTREDVYQNRDLHYFWAAMEVLRQADPGKSNIKKIKRLYRILQSKQLNEVTRGNIRLELALYLMSLGDLESYEASYNEIRPIVDVPPFRDDPVMNLCHGYTLHRLWHDRVVQDVEKQFVQDLGARPQHGADQDDYEEGGGDNDYMDVDERGEVGSMMGAMVVRQSHSVDMGSAEMLDGQDMGGMPFSSQGDRGFYEEDEEDGDVDDFWKTAVVRWSPDLDRRLFPVRLPQTRTRHLYKVPMDNGRTRDAHSSAIKYLRRALSLASDMTPALLPLVQLRFQLLLAAGDVMGAVDEIEKCSSTPHLLPLSVKALLLESLDSKSNSRLAKCYETILHVNPSSTLTLDRLVQLHASGKYKTEALVECIAVHLDVNRGLLEVWQQLAACLMHLNQRHNEQLREAEFGTFGQPQDFSGDNEETKKEECAQDAPYYVWKRRIWDERIPWWRNKHFHEKSVNLEQQVDGDMNRIAYKAACSVHILGAGNAYEVAVSQALTPFGARNLLSVVNAHSMNFHVQLAENHYSMESDSSHM